MTSKLTRGTERNQTRPFSEIDSGWCLRANYKKTVANFAKQISKMNFAPRNASISFKLTSISSLDFDDRYITVSSANCTTLL